MMNLPANNRIQFEMHNEPGGPGPQKAMYEE
jgi:hypothetical protein